MSIRKSLPADLPLLMALFARARAFMAETGNPNQWGPRNWPPQELIEADIASGNSYVVEEQGEIIGTFYFVFGVDVEPTYLHIEGPGWKYDGPYGVIHRIAAKEAGRGIMEKAVAYALSQCPHLRIDTHEDNLPMRNLMAKLGLEYRGIIYVENGTSPRLAFEK